MVEWATLLVTVVATLLERLDKRKEDIQHRPEVKDALIDLLDTIIEWEETAIATNNALWRWIMAGRPTDPLSQKELRRAVGRQVAYLMDDTIAADPMYLFPSGRARKRVHRAMATGQNLLFIYAPDIRNELENVSNLRLDQLHRITEELGHYVDPPQLVRALKAVSGNDQIASVTDITDEAIEELENSVFNIHTTAGTLATFIRTNFSLR